MAKLLLNGPMGGGFFSDDNTLVEQIKAVPDNEGLELQVTSGGGSVAYGDVLFNAIMEHKGKTTYKGVGLVASMAAVLMAAFDEVKLEEGVLLMFHKGYIDTWWDDDDYEPSAGEVFQVEQFNARAHARLLSKGADQGFLDAVYKSDVESDFWITSDDAVRMGFGKEFKVERTDGVPTEVMNGVNKIRNICNSKKKELYYGGLWATPKRQSNDITKNQANMNLFGKKKTAKVIKMATGETAVLNSLYDIPIKGDTISPSTGGAPKQILLWTRGGVRSYYDGRIATRRPK